MDQMDDDVKSLLDMLDAAHGLICNAHQKRVDDVTTEDGASPGWAEAARRWVDAYPPIASPDPAPDPAAVQIAERAAYDVGIRATPDDRAHAVAAALARADRLCLPGTKARLAALEAVARTVVLALDDIGRLHATTGGPELAAALDAAPAGTEVQE